MLINQVGTITVMGSCGFRVSIPVLQLTDEVMYGFLECYGMISKSVIVNIKGFNR